MTRGLGAPSEVKTYPIIPESPGPEQMVQALSEGAGSVVVADGDDIQRLVVRVLVGTGVPPGVLVVGTACVYSRNLELPHGLADTALAMMGAPRFMDLGWASLDGGSPGPFLVAIGMG